MDNLKIINAFFGISSKYKVFENRPSHVFIFKINGESEYTFHNKKITLSQNEILFIPTGECYTVKRLCKEESRYTLINFSADLENAHPEKYKLNYFSDVSSIFDKFVKSWLFQDTSGHYTCLSLFYKILSLITLDEEHNYCSLTQKNMLKPAMNYLEDHIFDCNLKAEHLHTLCGVSDTYFRQIFISEFGVTPKQYITLKRLMQAKNILENGDYKYIYEVAETVGYTDALYFSRIYKKQYGYAPSAKEMRNILA